MTLVDVLFHLLLNISVHRIIFLLQVKLKEVNKMSRNNLKIIISSKHFPIVVTL